MNKLVATTLESKFHVFDLRTQHPEKGFAMLSEKVSCGPNDCCKYVTVHRKRTIAVYPLWESVCSLDRYNAWNKA